VETVKGYAAHEKRTFLKKVTEARARAMGANTIKRKKVRCLELRILYGFTKKS
jgi:hypothetical protein